MFRRKNGQIFGVLNDFDLSVLRDQQTPSSKQRTGTKPYLAIDLLNKDGYEHKYRHDLESFFYVIVWLTSRYHDGEEIPKPPLQDWANLGGASLQKEKAAFILTQNHKPTPHFKLFGIWVASMQSAMVRGITARRLYISSLEFAPKKSGLQTSFDDETLGGNVTFDVFRQIMSSEIE